MVFFSVDGYRYDFAGSFGVCCVADVGCATDELWSTPDHKRNEHDPKQRVGEVLPKFYSVFVYCCLPHTSLSLSLFFSLRYLLYRLYK